MVAAKMGMTPVDRLPMVVPAALLPMAAMVDPRPETSFRSRERQGGGLRKFGCEISPPPFWLYMAAFAKTQPFYLLESRTAARTPARIEMPPQIT